MKKLRFSEVVRFSFPPLFKGRGKISTCPQILNPRALTSYHFAPQKGSVSFEEQLTVFHWCPQLLSTCCKTQYVSVSGTEPPTHSPCIQEDSRDHRMYYRIGVERDVAVP